jgi:hypothetical protein
MLRRFPGLLQPVAMTKMLRVDYYSARWIANEEDMDPLYFIEALEALARGTNALE